MTRFLESYKGDLIFALTLRKCLFEKHFLLATGLQNLTGLRTVIHVL